MKPGSLLKALLAPFVVGTRFENCAQCNHRADMMNNWWTKLISWFKTK